jgi:hypothetical protein
MALARIAFSADSGRISSMGNKDAGKREIRKPKKKKVSHHESQVATWVLKKPPTQ